MRRTQTNAGQMAGQIIGSLSIVPTLIGSVVVSNSIGSEAHQVRTRHSALIVIFVACDMRPIFAPSTIVFRRLLGCGAMPSLAVRPADG